MTKAEMIRALVEAKDYRLTHDEMMRMKKSELAAHIRTSKSFRNVPGKYATIEDYYKAVLNKAKGENNNREAMTDQEIDKWVESHANFTGDWTDDRSAKMKEDILKWGKIVAHKFYNLGRTLTVEDIKTILDISFWNDDPEKILQEYNRLKK